MNSLLTEIYSTIIPSAPYVIAAYVLLIIILIAFVGLTFSHLSKAEKQLEVLEDDLVQQGGTQGL